MTHLICAEIGGMNSIEPLLLGAEIGTVKPPNNGHARTHHLVLYSEVVLFSEVGP